MLFGFKAARSEEPGSSRGFEADVLTHLPALMAVARRLTRNEAESEDLVQDACVKALRARDQYEQGTNLRAWLIRILRNTFINRYHRAQLERAALAAPASDPVMDGWMSQASLSAMRDPEAMTLRPQLELELARCIDELPDEFRMVVLLADAEGFSYREVADTLGCPIGTVMSRLHRARRLLKSKLIHLARERGLVGPEEAIGEPSSAPVDLESYRESPQTKPNRTQLRGIRGGKNG
jgi:RNA polymerase sigma-70 factor, ECF subfamily